MRLAICRSFFNKSVHDSNNFSEGFDRMKKFIVFLTIFVLCTANANASVLGSETILTSRISVADGLYYNKNVFYSDQSGVGEQTEFYYEYTPQDGITPVITNGGSVYGKQTISKEAERLKNLGMYPLMAMNADFFSFKTGVPMSNLIMNGEIVSKDSTYKDGIGFFADGTAFVAPMQIHTSIRINDEEETIPIYNINKYPQPYQIYMLNSNYASTTTATKRSVNVIIGSIDGELKIGETVTGVVEDVGITNSSIDIPANKLVLVCDVTAPEEAINHISRFAVGQNVSIVNSCVSDERWEKAVYAMGCTGGLMISDGVIQDLDDSAAPRTAIGIKDDGTVIFYAIDGRQSGYSYGARIKTVSKRLLELGCKYAVNLDGGGSTSILGTMPGTGETVRLNSPSDGGERAVSTFVALLNTQEPSGNLHALNLYPNGGNYLSGAKENILIYGSDDNGYPVTVTDAVELTADGGEISGSTLTLIEDGTVTVTGVSESGAKGETQFSCHKTPDSITVKNEATNKIVTNLSVRPGETVSLTASSSLGNKALVSSDELYTWKTFENVGTIDEYGTFTAGEKICNGSINVTAGDKTVWISVSVDDGDIYETQKYPQGYFEEDGGNIVFTITNDYLYTAEKAEAYIDSNVTEAELSDGKVSVSIPNDGMHKIKLKITNSAGKTGLFRYTCGNPQEEYTFPDISENWAKDYITYMCGENIVNGMEENGIIKFKPSDTVTRAQFAVMTARMLNLTSTAAPGFADDGIIPSWAKNEIAALAANGIISGKTQPDGSVTFSPNDILTRAEAVTILARTLESGLLQCDISATDENDVPTWAYESFRIMLANGIISGYPDGTIQPLSGITRAEAVKILYELY